MLYIVVRVNSDASDIYASEMVQGRLPLDVVAEMCDTMVLPDDGDLVEWAAVLACDPCDARLHMSGTGRRWAIYRANWSTEANADAGHEVLL